MTKDDLFEIIVEAYIRGGNWRVENGASPFMGKAASDYADKTVSALSAAQAQPVAQLEFARGVSGRENEMPRVVSCNWLPDGTYSVYLQTPVQVPVVKALTEFRKFVDLIEGRAMACDGPVTPFLEQLNAASDAEKQRFVGILSALYREA